MFIKKRIIASLTVLTLIIGIMPTAVFAEDSTYWTVDGNGIVTFSGTGKIGKDAVDEFEYNKDITAVIIEEGITEIPDDLFYCCSNIKSVSFPSTLTEIGEYAFNGCKSLETITIPAAVEEIGDYAFYNSGGC